MCSCSRWAPSRSPWRRRRLLSCSPLRHRGCPAAPAAPAAETTTVTPPRPEEITLIVTPQDAITLTYLFFNEPGARLTLALRGAEDRSTAQTEAVTLQFLLDQYNIPIPVKLPYGIEPRLDRLDGLVPEPTPRRARQNKDY
jgi:hypothetical protein